MLEEPHPTSKEMRSERNCWVSALVDVLVVVVPKHSVIQPIWICVTPLVTCEPELGDGRVSTVVADCAAVPTNCTVTLSWTAT